MGYGSCGPGEHVWEQLDPRFEDFDAFRARRGKRPCASCGAAGVQAISKRRGSGFSGEGRCVVDRARGARGRAGAARNRLAACDGPTDVAGIQGTGSPSPAAVEGPITGFGSIFVDGIEYSTATAQVTIDGQAATESLGSASNSRRGILRSRLAGYCGRSWPVGLVRSAQQFVDRRFGASLGVDALHDDCTVQAVLAVGGG